MPRPFQFRLAALFWATGIIAVATAVTMVFLLAIFMAVGKRRDDVGGFREYQS